jgi:hypothetical protein
MASITSCPSCFAKLQYTPKDSDVISRCPKCGSMVKLPGAERKIPTPPPPPAEKREPKFKLRNKRTAKRQIIDSSKLVGVANKQIRRASENRSMIVVVMHGLSLASIVVLSLVFVISATRLNINLAFASLFSLQTGGIPWALADKENAVDVMAISYAYVIVRHLQFPAICSGLAETIHYLRKISESMK